MNTPLTSVEALNVINSHYHLGDVDYCMFLRRGFNDSYFLEVGSKKYVFHVYLEGKYYIDSEDAYKSLYIRYTLDLKYLVEERDSLQDLRNLRNLWDIGNMIATQNLRAE